MQDVASGYAYCYLTASEENPLSSDEEKETDKDEPRRGANVQVHVFVAATWFHGEAAPNKEVHHKNHNPMDNLYSNLQWVTPEEHRKIHMKDNRLKLYQTNKKDFQSICSVCLQENALFQSIEYECKKYFVVNTHLFTSPNDIITLKGTTQNTQNFIH